MLRADPRGDPFAWVSVENTEFDLAAKSPSGFDKLDNAYTDLSATPTDAHA